MGVLADHINKPNDKPTSQPQEGLQWVEKKGEYIAEQLSNTSNQWHVHLYSPITGSFLSHIQTAKGIDSAQSQTRHRLLVQVARMHQDNASEVIANAIESFKD